MVKKSTQYNKEINSPFFQRWTNFFHSFSYPLLIIPLSLETMISFNREKILKMNKGNNSLDSIKSLQDPVKQIFCCARFFYIYNIVPSTIYIK